MLKICNSEYVLKYNAMKVLNNEDIIKDIKFAQKNNTAFYIKIKTNNKLIGAVFIEPDGLRHKINSLCLSYFLKEEFAGCGYMTEALQQIIKHLFEDRNIDVISARAFAENHASISLLNKLGFTEEGRLRCAVCGYKEIVHDDVVFSMLKSDFTNKY